MQYAYPCDFTPDTAEGDGFVVTFPDLGRGATGAATFKESIILAEDALVVTLSTYMDCDEELPPPSPWVEGQELIGVQPLIAAQLDLYNTMRQQNLSRAALAKRLGVSQAAVKRLLTLNYRTPITQVRRALAAISQDAAADNVAEPAAKERAA